MSNKSDSSSPNGINLCHERLSETEAEDFNNNNVEMQAKHTIIFHPGSAHLRIGLASDHQPIMIPHVIAWRHKNPGSQPTNRMKLLPQDNKVDPSIIPLLTEAITSHTHKRRTTQENIARENSKKKPEHLQESCGWTWTDTSHLPKYLIGDDALYIDEKDCYDLFWPIVNGQLNLKEKSLTAVLADLEAIWRKAIENFLHIPIQDIKDYRCILLIPDIYNRKHVKHITDVILNHLNFSSIIIHQESVCATYGCGIANACVVDVGHHKTSVCVVEDGISHQNTQICLDYGGRNITHAFAWLLQQNNFPYRSCNIQDRMDALLLEELKETFCHLDLSCISAELQEFNLRRPGQMSLLYSILLGDEVIQAPIGVFYPQLFGLLQPSEHIHFYTQTGKDYGDLLNDIFLSGSKQDKTGNSKKTFKQANIEDKELVTTNPKDKKYSARDDQQLALHNLKNLLCLDQAIIWSIENTFENISIDHEVRKRLYSCILLVGGGLANFSGIENVLKTRIKAGLRENDSHTFGDQVEIINKPKNLDPSIIAWKGGAVLSCLNNAEELWITKQEWVNYGVRILREKCPFIW